MSRKSMFLAFACLATGALVGYAAASGKFDVFQRVTGAACVSSMRVQLKEGGTEPETSPEKVTETV